jgi:hypothetical protein
MDVDMFGTNDYPVGMLWSSYQQQKTNGVEHSDVGFIMDFDRP